jgi:hypothetical protein
MQCSSGYRGNLCGSCRRDQGYAQNRYFRCSKCLSPATNVVLLLLFAVVACALVVFVAWRNWFDAPPAVATLSEQGAGDDEGSKLSLADTFKVLIVYLQYLSIIGNLLVDWPPAAAFLFEAACAVFVTDSSRMMSLGCFGAIGEGVRMLLMVVVPLLVVGLACWVVLLLLGRNHQRKANVQAASKSEGVDLLISTALIGVFLFYSVLVGTTLSAFACIEAAGKLFWVRDLDLQCWHGEHIRASLALGVVGSLVLVVLVPAGTVALLLWGNTAGKLQESGFKRRCGFLCQLYRPQCCYWEGVVCLQTCALVSVDLFARRRGTFYQLILMALVLLANSGLANTLRPFRSKHQMGLYVTGTTCLLLTCLGVLTLLKGYTLEKDGGISEAERDAVAVLLLVMNLAFVALCVVLMARAAVEASKAVLGSDTMRQLQHRSARIVRSFIPSSRAAADSDALAEGSAAHNHSSSSATATPAGPGPSASSAAGAGQ